MAFIQQITVEGEETLLFNVSHAVGARAENFWTDIQLVQYLIVKIYTLGDTGNIWNVRLSAADGNDLPDPNTDFKNLKKTERWIRRFQKDGVQRNILLKIDGRADRAKGEISLITNTFYTIVALNTLYDGVMREAFHDDSPMVTALDDGFMPAALKGQLLVVR